MIRGFHARAGAKSGAAYIELARVAGGSFAALIRWFHARAGAKSGAAYIELAQVAGGCFAALIRGFHAREAREAKPRRGDDTRGAVKNHVFSTFLCKAQDLLARRLGKTLAEAKPPKSIGGFVGIP